MLIEELFANGTMIMGPSAADPHRQVGVFAPAVPARIASARAAELPRFSWLAGSWRYENAVPATRHSPAYADAGSLQFAVSERDGWIGSVSADGTFTRWLTFDPLSHTWIYLLMRGSYGMLRSKDGWLDDRIAFSGLMTMIGLEREWRMTWTRRGDDAFGFVNEERAADGTWTYIDEWRFNRVTPLPI
ncbi:MAG TPA: hypothetical protein VH417_06235 [Vicinamibacterales bacterium]|jgi:hypothetical protein